MPSLQFKHILSLNRQLDILLDIFRCISFTYRDINHPYKMSTILVVHCKFCNWLSIIHIDPIEFTMFHLDKISHTDSLLINKKYWKHMLCIKWKNLSRYSKEMNKFDINVLWYLSKCQLDSPYNNLMSKDLHKVEYG
jgi:hypothetical protein